VGRWRGLLPPRCFTSSFSTLRLCLLLVVTHAFFVKPDQGIVNALVIARSGTAATHPTPRTVVEAVQSDSDSALYRFNITHG